MSISDRSTAQFRYSFLDKGGKVAVSHIEATSRAEAMVRIRGLGHHAIVVEQDAGGQPSSRKRLLSAAAGSQLIGQIARLLAAGVTMEYALDMATDDSDAGIVAARMRALLRAGASPSAAAAQLPEAFDPADVALIQSGENTGDLSGAFAEIERLMLKRKVLQDRLRSALIYPAILILVATGSVLLILLHVIPQFEPMIADTTATLPLAARFVFGLSAIMQSVGWLIGLVFAAGFVWLARAASTGQLEQVAARHASRMPVLKSVFGDFAVARIARLLGTLLSRNISLVPAIDITRGAASTPEHATSLLAVRKSLQDGATLRASLQASGAFPVFLVRMVQVGEETGNIGAMLMRAADVIEERAEQQMQRFVILFQPMVLIVIGIIIGGLLYGLFSAILSINQTIL